MSAPDVRETGAEPRPARRADARARRARILLAARAVFSADPEAPLDRVIRASGVSAATVHRHFGTRRALRVEALAPIHDRCEAVVDDARANPDADAALREALAGIVGLRSRLAPATGSAGRAARSTAIGDLGALLERAQRAGTLRRDLGVDDLAVALAATDGLHRFTGAARDAAAFRLTRLLLAALRA